MRYELKTRLRAGEWRAQNCAMCGWNVDPDEDRYIAYCHECKGEQCHGTDKIYHISCMIEWRHEHSFRWANDDSCSHTHLRKKDPNSLDYERGADGRHTAKHEGLEPEWEGLERHHLHKQK